MRKPTKIEWHKEFQLGETPSFDDMRESVDPARWKRVYQMSALKNRFLIVDENSRIFEPTREQILDLAEQSADWDQLLTTKTESEKQIATKIWNRDGSRAENCGNGVRSLATLEMFRAQDANKPSASESFMEFNIRIDNDRPIETLCMVAPIKKSRSQSVRSEIDAGAMTHKKIIGTAPAHILITQIIDGVKSAAEVSYGNPHLVLFLDDSTSPQKESLKGKKLEANLRDLSIPFYRHGVNISFAQIRTDEAAIREMGDKAYARIDLQVWERGAGLTESCSSGAVATYYAACMQEQIKKISRGNIFSAPHVALKPLALEKDMPGNRDLNAFHAVAFDAKAFYLMGETLLERAGTLTL